MSDVAQGPDWWLASDGKWYPPTSRPAPPSAPPPPTPAYGTPPQYAQPQPPYYPGPYSAQPTYTPTFTPPVVSPALSGWLQGLLWAAGALAGLASLFALISIPAYTNYLDAPYTYDQSEYDAWNSVTSSFGAFYGLLILIKIPIFILMIIWSYKTHKAAGRLQPGSRKWSKGWSIGGWFIPFANLLIPKLVLSETEKIATAPRANGQLTINWRPTKGSPLGWWWWSLYIGSGLVAQTAGAIDDLRTGYGIVSFSLLCGAAACVLGVFYVQRISKPLSPQGLAGVP